MTHSVQTLLAPSAYVVVESVVVISVAILAAVAPAAVPSAVATKTVGGSAVAMSEVGVVFEQHVGQAAGCVTVGYLDCGLHWLWQTGPVAVFPDFCWQPEMLSDILPVAGHPCRLRPVWLDFSS